MYIHNRIHTHAYMPWGVKYSHLIISQNDQLSFLQNKPLHIHNDTSFHLSDGDIQRTGGCFFNFFMHEIYFCLRQSLFHVSVHDAETQTGFLSLRVNKRVLQTHLKKNECHTQSIRPKISHDVFELLVKTYLFNNIASNVSDQIVEIIVGKFACRKSVW